MKIEAVALMREARERIRNDIEAMSWIEEHEYLRSHLGWYESRLSPTPNNSATSDRVLAGRRCCAGQPERGGVR
ncbi:MAG: hypothetical protein N838_11630 [Thiohalocapsa sp. PB-PSB1]|jgi:hypothetical protein|nr:MAG: hypothetical protein N838_31815 [Thiohalocapsa sp. PB-PSB1]QQO53913.1 MAG: hypothetical protein N838_11630 [Thiohalocapsa sp. PB-PSB1]